MPIYEYRCNQCRRKSSHFFRSMQVASQPVCSHCGSSELTRIMSTFAVHHSWDSGINLPSSETLGDFDEDDPKSTAEWAKGMRGDMGDSFGGKEYDDLIARMESGGLDDEGNGGIDSDF